LPAPGSATSVLSNSSLPEQLTFPHGMIDFRLSGCTVASTLSVTLTLPHAVPDGAVLYKYGPTADDHTPHWYSFPATFNGRTVMYTITDGGLGDDDLMANGVIVDPSGVAVPGVATGDTSVPTPSAATATSPSAGGGSLDLLSLWTLIFSGLLFHRSHAGLRSRVHARLESSAFRGHHPGAYVTIQPCIQL
jgi:hypothetical protein